MKSIQVECPQSTAGLCDTLGTFGELYPHWGIENSCHWVLDVVFREDQSRARSGDCAQNLSTLRRFALNLLKTEPSKPKEPIRGKRIYAVLDQDYLESIIGLAQV